MLVATSLPDIIVVNGSTQKSESEQIKWQIAKSVTYTQYVGKMTYKFCIRTNWLDETLNSKGVALKFTWVETLKVRIFPTILFPAYLTLSLDWPRSHLFWWLIDHWSHKWSNFQRPQVDPWYFSKSPSYHSAKNKQHLFT